MKVRIFAAAVLLGAASPALAQGIDSHRSPYPASAYSGYAQPKGSVTLTSRRGPRLADRAIEQRAGGPLNALFGS